jgi:hypothetical protein
MLLRLDSCLLASNLEMSLATLGTNGALLGRVFTDVGISPLARIDPVAFQPGLNEIAMSLNVDAKSFGHLVTNIIKLALRFGKHSGIAVLAAITNVTAPCTS